MKKNLTKTRRSAFLTTCPIPVARLPTAAPAQAGFHKSYIKTLFCERRFRLPSDVSQPVARLPTAAPAQAGS